MVIYKVCTNINLTCTHNFSQLKKILNFQKCSLQILPELKNFLQICRLVELAISNTLSFGSVV
jgi:hypothetical protein